MERIGIYGGTFNPPHLGHIRAARSAVDSFGLSKLLMIPSCVPPHKQQPQNAPTPEQRLEMVQAAIRKDEKIQVSDIELRRGGVSFTYETVGQLRLEYPETELVLLMGTDMFLSFDQWREPAKILQNASLGVFYRGEKGEREAILAQKEKLESIGAKVYLAENQVTEISSTDLRRMLILDCAEGYLAPETAAYIRESNLYGVAKCYQNLSEEELEAVVVSLLKPSRVAHVLGCRQEAVKMAAFWGADETDAARAAILHDVTKALDGFLQLELCKAYGVTLSDFSRQNPKTLHALTGSLVAERIFGENKAVVEAVRWHTTGKADMTLLEKIIYVADYMEPNRDFPGVEKLRTLAYSDLDAALRCGLEMTLDMLRKQKKEISKESAEALRFLSNK